MTNYTSITTCVAIGENLAASLPVVLGVIRMPMLSRQDMELHVGLGADWNQRRSFELGLIRGIARRSGDTSTEAHCTTWIEAIKTR